VSDLDPGAIWRRATLLARQRRDDLARQELLALLAIDPGCAPAHALLSELSVRAGERERAREEAEAAIAADPGAGIGHYALARVLAELGRLEAAEAAIGRAIELEPEDPDHHGLRAGIRIDRKRFDDALADADAGLALDPQHAICLNFRSHALVRLGRQREATDTLDAALAHDPENPFTHQSRGFALLQRGDAAGALHHFREALRLDPTLDGARAGLVEALKARNPVYRMVLRFFLWMERFSSARQRQILLGAWVVMYFGRKALERVDGMGGVAAALGYGWFGVVMLTICAVPFFNLLLLLHPLGRHALPPRQRLDALLLGGAALVAIVVVALDVAEIGPWTELGSLVAVCWLLPVAGIGAVGDGWPRRVMQGFSAAVPIAYGWYSWRLEALLARADALIAAGRDSLADADAIALKAALDQHASLYGTLVLAIMLSTWFVAMVPKRWSHR